MEVFLTSLRKIPKSMQIKFNAQKKLKFYDDKTKQTSEFNACEESNYW
jgi:hypothetical protein